MLHRRECGSFRISLTYDAPTGTGKTTAYTHTLPGRLVKLVTNEQVVVEFETTDPALGSGITIARRCTRRHRCSRRARRGTA
jgi:hypothetical protein